MAFDKEFLTGVFDGIEDANERVEKVWKEYEADTTGLKVSKDTILKESKDFKDKLDKLAQEREAEKTAAQKRIEELETQIKSSGTEETKAFYEAEKQKIQDLYATKLADTEKAVGQHKTAYDELNTKYLKVRKDTELDKAMDEFQNLDPAMKPVLRDVFWARNQFEFLNVEEEEKLLNKDHRGVRDTLAAFLSTEEGKRFVLSNSTGGGATGSTSAKPPIGNPFTKGKENLDEQGRLLKENPAMYAQLKAQAEALAKSG